MTLGIKHLHKYNVYKKQQILGRICYCLTTDVDMFYSEYWRLQLYSCYLADSISSQIWLSLIAINQYLVSVFLI